MQTNSIIVEIIYKMNFNSLNVLGKSEQENVKKKIFCKSEKYGIKLTYLIKNVVFLLPKSKWVIFLLLNKRTNTYCDNPTILLVGYVIYLIVYGADWSTVKKYI